MRFSGRSEDRMSTIQLNVVHCPLNCDRHIFICPIAIAYRMGQIIQSVCVCQCVCVCVSVSRALSRSHFSIDFHQNWHRHKNTKSKNEFVRGL